MNQVAPVGAMQPARWRRLCSVLALVTLTGVPLSAVAEPSTSERNLAEQLFVSGRKLMTEGQYDEACNKLAESQRIDPAGGTILNLAICHQMQGRYASAWSELREALSLARKDGRRDRERLATESLAEVEPLVSRVVIRLGSNSTMAGLTVSLDGVAVGPAAWGSPMPVDPGNHEIIASAPGKRTQRVNLAVTASAAELSVTIPELQDDSETGSSARGMNPISVDANDLLDGVAADRKHAQSRPHDKTQTAALVAFAGSGVALTVGTVLGIVAMRKRHQSDAYCSGTTCRHERGVELNDDARRHANYANVSLGVGVAAAAVGLYLVLTSTADEAQSTTPVQRVASKRTLQVEPKLGATHAQIGLTATW